MRPSAWADAPGVAVVLGAGNVSSIGVVDSLAQVLMHGRATLLKAHPMLAPLVPVLRRALRPLIGLGVLEIIAGDGADGAAAAHHAAAAVVHVTGSGETLERVVWGDDTDDRERRMAAGNPVLKRSARAELGNATPWIVVPGTWSDRDLRAQAEHLAGAIASNASYNCICPKDIVTAAGWPQQERFPELVRQILAAVPPRPAYYPGSRSATWSSSASPPASPPARCRGRC